MGDEQGLKTGIRGLAAEARRGLEPHPSPGELLDYQAGDLAEEERERLQDHLALCPGCARTVLDLSAFPDVEPLREEDRLADSALASEWRRFQDRAGAAPAPRRPALFFPPRLAWALAASLLLAVAGLSIRVGRLRDEVNTLSGPRVNVLVADLVPRDEAVERSPDGEEAIRVPEGAERLLLVLNLAEAPSYPGYRIEIAALGGTRIWSHEGLRPSADGNFTLEVPRRLLADGRYVIRLYGLKGNAATRVAEYAVRVRSG